GGYSITSSALACSVSGTVRPRDLAVLRLRTNRKRVGCSNGRSAGFAPLRMRSTKAATRAKLSFVSGPYDIKPPRGREIRTHKLLAIDAPPRTRRPAFG